MACHRVGPPGGDATPANRKAVEILRAGYFDRLVDYLDHALAEQFLAREHRDMLLVENDPDLLIERLDSIRLPQVSKWTGPGET